jgi:outer membrane protein TolC
MRPSDAGSLLLSLVLGATVVSISPSVRAQDAAPRPPVDVPKPTRAMTLEQALAYAHAHQPAIRAALAEVKARMAEARVPSAQWLPTVGFSAQAYGMTANNSTGTYLQTSSLDVPRIGGTRSPSSFSQATLSPYAATFVGLGVEQELFDFGRIGAQRAAADALVDAQRRSADAARLDVDFGVEESFFSVYAAKAIVVASDQAYDRARVHRDFAKRGVDAGLRPPIELTRAEADLARFDVGRVRARGALAIAQNVLAAAIGAPDPAIDVSGAAPAVPDTPSLAEALSLAEARDPVVARAVAQLRAAEKTTHAIGAELRPDLGVTGTMSGRAGGAPSTTAGYTTPVGDGWLPVIPNWDVGVILMWPLFDGAIAARRDASEATEQVRRDEIEAAHLREATNVRQAYMQVQVARSALVALENQVAAVRANYEQAEARFRSGIGNAVELADAEAVRIDAEIQFAIGEFAVAQARAALGRAIAEGL